MSEKIISMQPNGPLMFRDPRPFSNDVVGGARSLDFPLPSTTSGAVRTAVAELAGKDFNKTGVVAEVLTWQVHGPLLHLDGKFYFPCPADALYDGTTLHRKAPLEGVSGGGSNLPFDSLMNVGTKQLDGKPENLPHYWPADVCAKWLAGETVAYEDIKKGGFSPEKDRRTHLKMDNTKQIGEDGMLFSSEGVSLLTREGKQGAYVVRFDGDAVGISLNANYRLGGEGHFAFFSDSQKLNWPALPEIIKKKLIGNKNLRLQLATPAIFKNGWYPDWLKDVKGVLQGCPPGAPGAELQLKAAAVKRWTPASGWDLAARGPKALRRMVPAGCVYYFEVLEGDAAAIAESLWLKPVCDDDQNNRDGFGLALWGTWQPISWK